MNEKRKKVINLWAKELGLEIPEGKAHNRLAILFKNFDDQEIARPFIMRDIHKGIGNQIITDRYPITASQLSYFKCRMGINKHKNIRTTFYGIEQFIK